MDLTITLTEPAYTYLSAKAGSDLRKYVENLVEREGMRLYYIARSLPKSHEPKKPGRPRKEAAE